MSNYVYFVLEITRPSDGKLPMAPILIQFQRLYPHNRNWENRELGIEELKNPRFGESVYVHVYIGNQFSWKIMIYWFLDSWILRFPDFPILRSPIFPQDVMLNDIPQKCQISCFYKN